jgi:hypothetical protein
MDQDLKLYTLVATGAGQTDRENNLRQQIASSGVLNQDGGNIEQIASEPADQQIRGHYRARYAAKMAQELEELASSGLGPLPVTALSDSVSTALDGYYEIESADIAPPRAATEAVQRYDVSLSKKGTRNSAWRALETNPSQVDHDEQWGNDTTELVGMPSTASKVRWYRDETSAVAPASATSTRQAELGDVEIFDLADGRSALSLSSDQDLWLIYDIDYGAEETVDIRVWDTRGYDSKHDNDGGLQWAKLFNTQHDFDDLVVLDSGVLRLELDEAAGTITAETWESSTSSWTSVGMSNDSSWSLLDVDLTHVGMVRVDAQLTFSDGSSLYALDAILGRGDDSVLFAIPDGESAPIPSGIVDWLDPVAASTVYATAGQKDLIDRQEVRR